MMTKNVLIPIVTFLVGAGVTFLITQKLLEKKYADIAEAEITSMREAMERAKHRPKFVKEKKKITVDRNKVDMGTINPNGTLTRSSIDNDPYEKAKRDYHKISILKSEEETAKDETPEPEGDIEPDTDTDTDDETSDFDDGECDDAGQTEQDMLNLMKVDRTQPYVITDQQYSEENGHYDKISLYYYRIDDVLTEDNEEIIDDIDSSIGWDALHVLDMQTNVWVRNERIASDYEVIALNSSFAESVHGLHIQPLNGNHVATPRERYEEKQRLRKENGE